MKEQPDFKIDTQNEEFRQALQLVAHTNRSFFLTGKAGTGKSTFIKYVCANTKKKFIVLAPTGIAAINVGGVTLHSFFHLPFHLLLPDDPNYQLSKGRLYKSLKYNRSKRKMIEAVELIIIDEISMVRPDMLDFIDRILRVYCRNMRQPFGGKQLVLVGDVFQLEPVVQPDERGILHRFYPNAYFFSAHVFREMPLVTIELTKIYRQTDEVFISMLNRIRTNTATPSDLQLLNMRHTDTSFSEEDMSVTLAARRATVDSINEEKLKGIDQPEVRLKGVIKGDFPQNALPTQIELVLKIGAQVMLLRNDRMHRWANGTLAKVQSIGEDFVCVQLEHGEEVEVSREVWENIRYTYNEKEKKIETQQLGTFTQFPLRLAWAITIHKSQGLTLQHAVIDLAGGAFAAGQTYVALSRCKSLDGIRLTAKILPTDIFVRPEVVQFAAGFNDRRLLHHAFEQAKADIAYTDSVRAYDAGNMEEALEHFFIAIHARYDIEKPLPRRFIRRKLHLVNELRTQNRNLQSELSRCRIQMAGLAEEFSRLGDEALKYQDIKAAMANYDKALSLDPVCLSALSAKIRLLGTTHQDALPLARRMLEAAPGVQHYVLLAECLLSSGQGQEAYEAAASALDIDVDSADAHEAMGRALVLLGNNEQAVIHLALADELRKTNEDENKTV